MATSKSSNGIWRKLAALSSLRAVGVPKSRWCPWSSRPLREIPTPEGADRALTAVSAARYSAISLSPNSIATVFGAKFFASPSQVNFLVPAEAARGTAVLNLIASDGRTLTCHTRVEPVSPGLFGAGEFAAANLVRVRADNSSVYEPVVSRDPATGAIVPVPIRFEQGDRLFLALYGTGIRAASSQNLIVRVGPADGPAMFAGAHPTDLGLDQVNFELPPSLAGAGKLPVMITAEWNGLVLESNELQLVFGN